MWLDGAVIKEAGWWLVKVVFQVRGQQECLFQKTEWVHFYVGGEKREPRGRCCFQSLNTRQRRKLFVFFRKPEKP